MLVRLPGRKIAPAMPSVNAISASWSSRHRTDGNPSHSSAPAPASRAAMRSKTAG